MEAQTPPCQPQKGLTFEDVWAMFQKTDEQIRETSAKVAELSKNIGGLNNSLGALIEEVYSAYLWEKFDALGYEFTRGSRGMKFRKNGRLLAEVDIFLENGDYAMPVEVKTQLTTGDVDKHLARIARIREYLDNRSDKRKLVGAIAGGIVPDEVRNYAQEKGLYVIVQSGESVTIAETPPDFKVMEWEASSLSTRSSKN
jgi:hypothetical protein